MFNSPKTIRIVMPALVGLWLTASNTWEWHQVGHLEVRQWWLLSFGVFSLFTGVIALAIVTAYEVRDELHARAAAAGNILPASSR